MRLLNTKEAAAYLRVSEATMHRWRCEGSGPDCTQYKQRGPRYYTEQQLDDWLAKNTVKSAEMR